MSMEPVIEFDGVGKRFTFTSHTPQSVLEGLVKTFSWRGESTPARHPDDLWALRDVSFRVMPGQCLGLIGRNGSGKSTALKLIARILRPSTGRIVVRGRVSALLELGAGFHHDLTGRENISLNASVLGLSQRDVDACFDSIVEFSELGDFIETPVKHYSSGMFMRLGFSIAVHVRPDVLIVDEILAVGDQAFQQKCLQRIYRMKEEEGTTILIVSHNARTVRDICTDLVWLEQGRVRAAGAVDEVLPGYVAHYDREQATQPMTRDREGLVTKRPLIQIHKAALYNVDGVETTQFHTGETVQATVAYTPQNGLLAPRLEVGVFHADGLLLHQSSQPVVAGAVGVPVSLRVRFPQLPLLPGAYRLQTAVYDGDTLLGMRDVAFEMTGTAVAGLVALPTEWEETTQS